VSSTGRVIIVAAVRLGRTRGEAGGKSDREWSSPLLGCLKPIGRDLGLDKLDQPNGANIVRTLFTDLCSGVVSAANLAT